MKTRSLTGLLAFALAVMLATATHAHDAEAKSALALGLAAEAAPIAARYVVTVERLSQAKRKPQIHTWYFYRSAQQVALLKGSVDELWYRDAQQRISFERVFHADERVVDYSTGELATLHVHVDWAALSRLMDPAELVQLKRVSQQGKGRDARLHLRGGLGKERLEVVWLTALQLPQQVTRHVPGVSTVRLQLVSTAQSPQLDWPAVGEKSANYLHLDAADFGDMADDPVVRKSEALDARLGWRSSHQHD